MIQDSLVLTVQSTADLYELDWRDLAALVDVESSGGRNRNVRTEPRVKDMSIGVCQVLTGTAAWLVHTGKLRGWETAVQLTDAFRGAEHHGITHIWGVMDRPEVSVDLCAAYFRWQLDRYQGVVEDAVAAYNAGSVRRLAAEYSNQAYVDKWNKARKDYDSEDAGGTDTSVPSAW